jgi:hypothetical protein
LLLEVFVEGRLEAFGLPVAALVERGIELQMRICQRLAVDPLDESDAAKRKRTRDEAQALDGHVVDKEKRDDGDVPGDEELPEELPEAVYLRSARQVDAWIAGRSRSASLPGSWRSPVKRRL